MFLNLTELISAFEARGEDLFIELICVRQQKSSLAIDILIDDSGTQSARTIVCTNVSKHRICLGEVDRIELATEHPLLWNELGSLFWSSAPQSPQALVRELISVHDEIAGSWVSPLDTIMPLTYKVDIRLGSGILAQGQIELLTEYQKIAEAHKMNTAIIGKHIYPATRAATALLIGDSFFVGDSAVLQPSYP